MSKENDRNRVHTQNRTSEVYIRGMNVDKGKEIVNTKEKVDGMTPSQALNNFFLDKMSDPQNGERFTNQLGGWVRQEGRTVKKDIFSALESLAPTDSEIIKPWLLTVAEKSLVDRDRLLFQKTGKSTIDWTIGDNLKKYYALTSDMESKWDKLSILGRNVEVHPDRLNKSELIRSQLEEGFLGIGDALFDFVSNATDLSTGKFAKLGIGVAAAEVLLAACTPKVTPTVEVAPMPDSGEAVPIGVLYAEDIALLPEGAEKDNLQREIDNVEQICGTIPDCIGGTEKIYRVATADTVYSMRFADFLAPGETVPHTKILSIMDGKTQESVDINKDLLAAKGVTLDGINTTGYYYYDDDGKEHFVMVEKEKESGDQFIVYDTNGNYYDVVTQNEKEVRAYSHLWEEPGIVKAEALPTPTIETTATAETLKLMDQLKFGKEIPQLSQKEMSDIVAGAHRFKDDFGNIYALGYIPQMNGYFSVEGIVFDIEKSINTVEGDEFWRLLMITEDKRAGGFETADEKKFMVVPMYIDDDKENKYKISFIATPGGTPSTDSSPLVKVDIVIPKLMEQKEKYGNFQINALSYYSVSESDLEGSKSLSGWEERKKGVMRIYNNSDEAETFVDYMLNNDYDGAVSYLNTEKPYLPIIYIGISSD